MHGPPRRPRPGGAARTSTSRPDSATGSAWHCMGVGFSYLCTWVRARPSVTGRLDGSTIGRLGHSNAHATHASYLCQHSTASIPTARSAPPHHHRLPATRPPVFLDRSHEVGVEAALREGAHGPGHVEAAHPDLQLAPVGRHLVRVYVCVCGGGGEVMVGGWWGLLHSGIQGEAPGTTG